MDKKKKKGNSPYSFKKLIEEFKKIKWLSWKTKDKKKGVFRNTVEVIGLLAVTSVFLWLCNLLAVPLFK